MIIYVHSNNRYVDKYSFVCHRIFLFKSLLCCENICFKFKLVIFNDHILGDSVALNWGNRHFLSIGKTGIIVIR